MSKSRREGIAPREAGKAREIGVGCADRQSVLDCNRCEMRVRNVIARRLDIAKDLSEHLCVILSRFRNPDSGMIQPFDDLLPRRLNPKRAAK